MTEPEDMQPLSPNGDAVEIEIPAVTAPTMPVEHTLNNCASFYQRMVGGGMQIKFVPLVATAQSNMPAPEAYVILFSAEGWEGFMREVAAGGVKSRVEAVRNFEGGKL